MQVYTGLHAPTQLLMLHDVTTHIGATFHQTWKGFCKCQMGGLPTGTLQESLTQQLCLLWSDGIFGTPWYIWYTMVYFIFGTPPWYIWLHEVWLEILSPLPAFKRPLICPTDKVRLWWQTEKGREYCRGLAPTPEMGLDTDSRSASIIAILNDVLQLLSKPRWSEDQKI